MNDRLFSQQRLVTKRGSNSTQKFGALSHSIQGQASSSRNKNRCLQTAKMVNGHPSCHSFGLRGQLQEDHVYMNRCQLELMQHLLQIESTCHRLSVG